MTTITITPTGGDDSSKIQSTINGLNSGDTIQLNGNFKSGNPVKMPSNINWILNGTITATKAISILVNNGKITNISMSGGTYQGIGQTTNTGRLVEFTNGVTNSKFSDMIFENADHTFGLSVGCSENICTNLIARNSINGLADRGNGNTWNDCICENNSSDNWIVKCQNSIFNRAIGRNSPGAVGFGFYARVDGSNDIGADISGNKFFDCQAYGNGHSGFSLNCPTNGAGAKINNNFIQAVVHDNGKKQDVSTQAGIYLRNKLSSSTLKNNQFDVLAYNNGPKGGFALEASSPITGNTGSFVVYGNSPNDINLEKGTGNTFTVFHPTDKPAPKIVKGTNTVTVTDFNCSNVPSAYCTQKYCGSTSSVLTSITISPATASININGTTQLTAICKDQNNNTMACPALTWSSTDSTKATVDTTGKVTGIAIGTANITAKSGSITSNNSTITVSTVAPVLTSITISPATASININGTIQLTATCKDQNNNTMTCPTLTWKTSNNTIATVNSTGKVTGIAIGMTNITTASGSITSDISTITVTTTVEKKFSINDITQDNSTNKTGVLVILDDTGAFNKDQACAEVCLRLGQI